MKIGILTYWWSNDNYGQLLQCYALQKYLRDKGHDAFLVRYHPIHETQRMSKKQRILFTINHPIRGLRIIYNKIFPEQKLLYNEENNSKRDFDSFRKNHIVSSKMIFTSYQELKNNYPKADIYIVGSDQIWNIDNEYATSIIDAWYLNFLPDSIKRYSYAASFGRRILPNAVTKVIKTRLEKFSFVTVREDSGRQILKKAGIDVEVVCDPTLLLSVNSYLSLFSSISIKKSHYVFLYLLSNTCTFSVKKFKNWAFENGLDVVYVSGNEGYIKCNYDDEGIEKTYPTIQAWLANIANAEYVITNSFHCSVFSILFKKKIAVVPLEGTVKNTNNRIDSLFKNLNVNKTVIENNSFSVLYDLWEQNFDGSFIEKSKKRLNSFVN